MATLETSIHIDAPRSHVYAKLNEWAGTQKLDVTQRTPDEGFEMRATSPFPAVATFTLSDNDSGTLVHVFVDAKVPRIMEGIVRGQAKRQIDDGLQQLKQQVEESS